MSYTDRKEYMKDWRQAHRDEQMSYQKAWRQAHKEYMKAYAKDYYKAHKDKKKAWRQANRDKFNAYMNALSKSDTNSQGKTKNSVRCMSRKYLFNTLRHTKVEGYEIHHCFGYEDHRKFIYIPKELHLQIHQYLRDNGIDADSNHYSKIEPLVVGYLKCNERHVLIMNGEED